MWLSARYSTGDERESEVTVTGLIVCCSTTVKKATFCGRSTSGISREAYNCGIPIDSLDKAIMIFGLFLTCDRLPTACLLMIERCSHGWVSA